MMNSSGSIVNRFGVNMPNNTGNKSVVDPALPADPMLPALNQLTPGSMLSVLSPLPAPEPIKILSVDEVVQQIMATLPQFPNTSSTQSKNGKFVIQDGLTLNVLAQAVSKVFNLNVPINELVKRLAGNLGVDPNTDPNQILKGQDFQNKTLDLSNYQFWTNITNPTDDQAIRSTNREPLNINNPHTEMSISSLTPVVLIGSSPNSLFLQSFSKADQAAASAFNVLQDAYSSYMNLEMQLVNSLGGSSDFMVTQLRELMNQAYLRLEKLNTAMQQVQRDNQKVHQAKTLNDAGAATLSVENDLKAVMSL